MLENVLDGCVRPLVEVGESLVRVQVLRLHGRLVVRVHVDVVVFVQLLGAQELRDVLVRAGEVTW